MDQREREIWLAIVERADDMPSDGSIPVPSDLIIAVADEIQTARESVRPLGMFGCLAVGIMIGFLMCHVLIRFGFGP